MLLWALLALVKQRPEELLRIEAVLTGFMQAWQAQASLDPSTVARVIPVSPGSSPQHGYEPLHSCEFD